MKKFYYCGGCAARFEAEETLFEGTSAVCPACGKTRPIGEFAEINFCPHCQSEIAIPLDVPPGTVLKCAECSAEIKTDSAALFDAAPENNTPAARSPETLYKKGDFFDKFEIVRLLGRGGMGEVYLARHLLLNRECALKILSADNAGDSITAARFIQEAKLANRIDHPNLVRVFDAGEDLKTGRLFISMEYVDGWTLSRILKERRLDEADALMIGIEVCRVLEVLEANGIVHRDIKPSNIMIDRTGKVKLTDLGIAKSESRRNGDMTLTQESVVFGTPEYSAPEQCRSAHAADHRSDIYSLGATLFHLVGGEPPYSGDSPLDVVVKVLKEPPRSLYKLNSGLSAGFLLLIRDMMRRDPARRPAHASEVRSRMETLAAGRSSNLLERLPKNLVQTPWFDRLLNSSEISNKLVTTVSGKFTAFWAALNPAGAGRRPWRWFFYAALVLCGLPLLYFQIPAAIPEPALTGSEAFSSPSDTASSASGTSTGISAEKADPAALPGWLTDRMRHCRERQTQAKHLPETTPGQRQFKQARQAFLDRQQALLEQQVENHRRAVVAAAATYDQYKSAAVGNLMRAIRRSGRNEEKVKQLHARMLALLKDPATDPNLQIFDSRKRKYVSPLFAEFDYANGHERRRVELTEVLIRRHIRLPESLPAFYPGQGVMLIRYGVGRVDFIDPDRPKFYAENAFSPDILLAGVFGESESLPPVPIKKHRIVSRFSVLHYAVLKNSMMRFRFALEAVSSPSVTDSDGQTALHWAVKYGHSDFIAPLLAAGCDPAVRDRKGRLYTDCGDLREIHLLSRKDRFDVPSIIQRAENVNILLENGRTPLQHFVDDAAICRLLLEKGADPRLLGPDDLHLPICHDFSKKAEMFLPVAPDVLCAVPTYSLQMTLLRSRLVKQSSLHAAIQTAFDRLSPEDRDDLMRHVLQDVHAERASSRPASRLPEPEKLSWTDQVLLQVDNRVRQYGSSLFDSLRELVGKEK